MTFRAWMILAVGIVTTVGWTICASAGQHMRTHYPDVWRRDLSSYGATHVIGARMPSPSSFTIVFLKDSLDDIYGLDFFSGIVTKLPNDTPYYILPASANIWGGKLDQSSSEFKMLYYRYISPFRPSDRGCGIANSPGGTTFSFSTSHRHHDLWEKKVFIIPDGPRSDCDGHLVVKVLNQGAGIQPLPDGSVILTMTSASWHTKDTNTALPVGLEAVRLKRNFAIPCALQGNVFVVDESRRDSLFAELSANDNSFDSIQDSLVAWLRGTRQTCSN